MPQAKARDKENKMHYIFSEKTIGTTIEVQLSSLNLGGHLCTKLKTACWLELAPSTTTTEESNW